MRFLIFNATEYWLILVGSFQCVWLFQYLQSQIELKLVRTCTMGEEQFWYVSFWIFLVSLTFPKVMSLLRFCLFFWSRSETPVCFVMVDLVLHLVPCWVSYSCVHISCSSFIYIHLNLIKRFSANCVLRRFLLYPCSWLRLTPLLTSGATRFARGH